MNNKIKHGYCKHPLYRTWWHIQERCYKPKCHKFERYGGRGITCCDEWQDPKVFIEWCLANGWQSHLQIDRKDNDGNYEPSNCRFTTRTVQQRNTSSNRWIEFNGERKVLSQWSEELDIKAITILTRLRRGWSVSRALGFE